MKIIFIIISIMLLILWYIIGVKENLKITFINEQAIENIKAKDKREVSKKLSDPLIPMAVLLGSFAFMDNKWGEISYIILLSIFILFIFIEVKNIKNINNKFKNKVIKIKKRNKNKK